MKQAIMHTATRLPHLNVFEQGAGLLNVTAALRYLQSLPAPTVTLFPSVLDFTDCPYMWPFCDSPVFADSAPIVANVTVLNGIGPTSRVVGVPEWVLSESGNEPDAAGKVTVSTTFPDVMWPWTGWLGVEIAALDTTWSGVVRGHVVVVVETYPEDVVTTVVLPITIRCYSTPPRHKRILMDVFHSLRYPSGTKRLLWHCRWQRRVVRGGRYPSTGRACGGCLVTSTSMGERLQLRRRWWTLVFGVACLCGLPSSLCAGSATVVDGWLLNCASV